MADIFLQRDLKILMRDKIVWFLGDSNVRGLYKDFLWLWQRESIIPDVCLRSKLEKTFLNDQLVSGSVLTRGRNYEEDRRFIDMDNKFTSEFMFMTKCLTDRLKRKFNGIQRKVDWPDVIIMNSCLWDITRWGPNGVTEYKANLISLMRLFKEKLPRNTLVLWLTTPPVSSRINGGFLIDQLQFMQNSCRFEILEANLYASDIVASFGFHVIDVHFYLLQLIDCREKDGIHWTPKIMRFLTNHICTHISLFWQRRLPGNFESKTVHRLIGKLVQPNDKTQVTINNLEQIAKCHLGGPELPSGAAAAAAQVSKTGETGRRRQGNQQNDPPPQRSFIRNNKYAPY